MTAYTLGRALTASAAGLLLLATAPAKAELYWDFAYSGQGVAASGVLITGDQVDADGYYLATGILGQRNGSTITGLQPAGTAIPLNEPFKVDNLLRADGQLSSHGLGFATASGDYANLFLAGWLSPARTVEFASQPLAGSTSEVVVSWQLTARTQPLPAIPEPGTAALALGGLALLAVVARRGSRNCSRNR